MSPSALLHKKRGAPEADAGPGAPDVGKKILLRTNCLICVVIVLGFFLTALFSITIYRKKSIGDIEKIALLTSNSVFTQISSALTKPVNLSIILANDSLLQAFLSQESSRLDDPAYLDSIRNYLNTYQEQYPYDSLAVVSAATNRYYNAQGTDRVLSPSNPADSWFFDGVQNSDADFIINVEQDQAAGAQNALTFFANAKIRSSDGTLMGAVGVGIHVASLQQLLQDCRDRFGANVYLLDDTGRIQLSTVYSGSGSFYLSSIGSLTAQEQTDILSWKSTGSALQFWAHNSAGQSTDYIVTRYLPELNWRFVVEQDTHELTAALNRRIMMTLVLTALILSAILCIITRVIHLFNRKLVSLTRNAQQERQTIFEEATEQLFESIYELDITNNRPANAATEAYFESLGAPPGTPYDQALYLIAEKQIKPAFRQGYLDTFLPQNVLNAYAEGRESLSYELMITRDGAQYYWMRITTRIVRWESDSTIHLLVYRQNIDAEKRREQTMLALAQIDEMTGLLTKTAAQRRVDEQLALHPVSGFVYFILDIDNFKQANDQFGHAFGDAVILAFVQILRESFRRDDTLGRLGGDEFSVFLSTNSRLWAERKAAELCTALNRTHTYRGLRWHMSASIGAAFYPQDGTDAETLYRHADAALYRVKRKDKNGYAFYNAAIDHEQTK